MTHRLLYNPHFHTSQIFLGMVRALRHPASRSPALGIRPPALSDLPHPVFTPAASEIEAGRQLIRDLTRSRRTPPLVLVNANCSDILPLRRWAPENYVALARRLLDAYPGIVVAFTGAPDEAPHVERLLARVDSRRTICLAGRTTLRELLVLYGLSELLITNDSGPAHFATLTPIDVITLFGPETPRLFGSTSPRSHLISAGVFCSPCVSAYSNRFSRCTNNLCMQMISVDEVFAKAREILDRRVGSEVGARAVRSR
jgi:ADP-heptose:LPS heptosyltransferase